MARIRTVKPEFFTSESVCSVSPLARLLFIGLWCEADREGRLKWKPKTLKIRYLPVDNCHISEVAGELIEEKMIIIYTVDDVEYCEIPAFKSHQVINNREKASELPERVSTRQPRVKAEGRKERKGKEGKEREDIDYSSLGLSEFQFREISRIRKQNKAKSTINQNILNTLVNEIKKASNFGMSFNQCLQEWELRGWQAFKADWVKPDKRGFSNSDANVATRPSLVEIARNQ
ncbi:MAG: hypothetical protein ACN2B6_01250 [Rickettsiales bacterium]